MFHPSSTQRRTSLSTAGALALVVGLLAMLLGLSAGPVLATEAGESIDSPYSVTDDQSPSDAATEVESAYVLAVWEMPSWTGDRTPTWPQTLHASFETDVMGLNQLNNTFECGSYYQIDLYNNDETTDALLEGGELLGPNNPKESFPKPQGWDKTYRLQQTELCSAVPQPPVVTSECGEPDEFLLPEGPVGVSYEITSEDEGGLEYAITATPAEGYELDTDGTDYVEDESGAATIMITLVDRTDEVCSPPSTPPSTPPTPEDVTVSVTLTTADECGVAGTFTFDEQDGVVWRLDGVAVTPGTYTYDPETGSSLVAVDASDDDLFVLTGTTEFDLTGLAAVECDSDVLGVVVEPTPEVTPEPTPDIEVLGEEVVNAAPDVEPAELAATGLDSALGLALGSVLVAGGLLLLLADRRRQFVS
jgi:hypothetical protein